MSPPQAAASPMTASRARALLTVPPGSLSFGKTSRGRIVQSARIPLSGPGYQFFPHIAERGTHYGTDEMKALLPRLGKKVQQRVRGTPKLRVGNVSLRRGGRSQWHVSHQAGRDVDLCMYGLNRETKKPALVDNFVKYRWRGLSRDGRLVFDSRRNMELVRALVTDEQVNVQWIFVARWLQRRIMAAAAAAKVPDDIRTRMKEVMRQPSDSAPHDDHFHVRIYCSVQDRKHGCVMRDPIREWADLGEEEFGVHIGELMKILDLPQAELRLRALSRLQGIQAAAAVGAVAERLLDKDKRVRQAALMALLSIGAPEAGAPILAQMPHIEDPAWARSVLSVLTAIDAPQLLQVAHIIVKAPSSIFHREVRKRGLESFKVRAAEIFRTRGRRHAVPSLLALMGSRSRRIRNAAHTALLYVTGQRIHARRGRAPWTKFWASNKNATWLSWMRSGLRSWGVRVSQQRFTRGDVPKLIRALRHGSRVVRRNAEKVLTALTGHEISDGYRAKLRSHYRVARHWKYWWKRHKRRYPQLRAG